MPRGIASLLLLVRWHLTFSEVFFSFEAAALENAYDANAFTAGNPFWGTFYLELVLGGVWGF